MGEAKHRRQAGLPQKGIHRYVEIVLFLDKPFYLDLKEAWEAENKHRQDNQLESLALMEFVEGLARVGFLAYQEQRREGNKIA